MHDEWSVNHLTGGQLTSDVRVARLAARQHGAVTFQQLLACGLTRREIEVRVRLGHLHPFIGVFTPWPQQRLTGGSLPRRGDGVRCPRGAQPRRGGSAPRPASLGLAADRRDRAHEANPPGHQDAPRHDDRADLRAGHPRHTQAPHHHRPLPHRGRRHGQARAPPGQAHRARTRPPTASPLEDIVLDLILKAGFAHPEGNAPYVLPDRIVYPDLRWPQQRLIVEVDSREWHTDPLAQREDARRQADLEAVGERVLRITHAQATTQAARTLARLRAAGAPYA